MKINDRVLSIPPYVSTSWEHIKAIHLKGTLLVVTLCEGDSINIPGLGPEVVERIFECHSGFIETRTENPSEDQSQSLPSFLKGFNPSKDDHEASFRIGFSPMDNLGAALQHNPSQSNAPDLPKEMLNKIQAIAKIVAPEETITAPKPEPHCNCFHCQIARAIHNSAEEGEDTSESFVEYITEEDLKFEQWDIKQTGDNIYQIINKLDRTEQYNVCLEPIGCTCGEKNCEHILAVLKS